MKQHQSCPCFGKSFSELRLEGKLKDTDACFFPLANDRPVAQAYFWCHFISALLWKSAASFWVVCINLTIYCAVSLFFGCKSLCLIQGCVCWWPPGHVAVSQEYFFSWALKAFVFLTFSSLFGKPVDVDSFILVSPYLALREAVQKHPHYVHICTFCSDSDPRIWVLLCPADSG